MIAKHVAMVRAGTDGRRQRVPSKKRSGTRALNNSACATNNTAGGSANVTWNLFGRQRGTIPTGTLFDVKPASGYTGDLEVTVYLANPDEWSKNYRFWNMRLQLVNGSDVTADSQGLSQVLSMDNGKATFFFPSENITGDTYYLNCLGGGWVALPYIPGHTYTVQNPQLFCEVTQSGQ